MNRPPCEARAGISPHDGINDRTAEALFVSYATDLVVAARKRPVIHRQESGVIIVRRHARASRDGL